MKSNIKMELDVLQWPISDVNICYFIKQGYGIRVSYIRQH